MLIWLMAALIMLGDQLTKAWVAKVIPLGQSRVVLPGFLSLTYVRNAGAAFGILQFQLWLFIAMAIGVVTAAVLFRHEIKRLPPLIRYGLGVALGGTLGNLVDRLRFGRVQDFLDIYRWPIFNLADTAIVCGVGLILLAMILKKQPVNGG